MGNSVIFWWFRWNSKLFDENPRQTNANFICFWRSFEEFCGETSVDDLSQFALWTQKDGNNSRDAIKSKPRGCLLRNHRRITHLNSHRNCVVLKTRKCFFFLLFLKYLEVSGDWDYFIWFEGFSTQFFTSWIFLDTKLENDGRNFLFAELYWLYLLTT